MWVRIRPFFPHTLPKGLTAGRQVEVIRADHDLCVVQDESGTEWLVDSVLLDPGHMVWIDGHWEPETEEEAGSANSW